MKATEDTGRASSSGDDLTCAAAEVLAIRMDVSPLDPAEDARLTQHLARCAPCRRTAIESSEFVASLRTLNDSLGSPSRHFGERLRARVAIERALSSPTSDGGAGVGAGQAAAASPRGALPPRETPSRPATRTWIETPSLPGRRPQLLLLAGVLVLSIVLNLLAVSSGIFGSKVPPPSAGRESTLASAPPSSILAGERLLRLRAAQTVDGLLAGDPVATAWWLVAESRALTSAEASPLTTEPLSFERVERAQKALLEARYPNALARATAALALVESARAFGQRDGMRARIAAFAGFAPDAALEDLIHDRIRWLAGGPAKPMRWDGAPAGGAARARRQVERPAVVERPVCSAAAALHELASPSEPSTWKEGARARLLAQESPPVGLLPLGAASSSTSLRVDALAVVAAISDPR